MEITSFKANTTSNLKMEIHFTQALRLVQIITEFFPPELFD